MSSEKGRVAIISRMEMMVIRWAQMPGPSSHTEHKGKVPQNFSKKVLKKICSKNIVIRWAQILILRGHFKIFTHEKGGRGGKKEGVEEQKEEEVEKREEGVGKKSKGWRGQLRQLFCLRPCW